MGSILQILGREARDAKTTENGYYKKYYQMRLFVRMTNEETLLGALLITYQI
jgi:hypothetical protein